MTYFLDTNIISYVLANNKDIIKQLQNHIDNDDEIKIPIVAYYEIKRGLYAVSKEKQLRFQYFISEFEIVEMTVETFKNSANIYENLAKQGKIIEDDDIFIGASALEHNAILITNNEKHLGRIKDLKLEVWS